MGSIPTWYRLIRGARALGVTPWELAQQPVTWLEWGIAVEAIDAQVAEIERSRRT